MITPFARRLSVIASSWPLSKTFFFEGSLQPLSDRDQQLAENALSRWQRQAPPVAPATFKFMQRSGGHGRITFTDRGIGMTPEVMKAFSSPFFSTKSGMGHGLGLSYRKSD